MSPCCYQDYNDQGVVNDILYNDDDVCDSMAQSVGSSFNSPDVKKRDKVKTSLYRKFDKEPRACFSKKSQS